MTNYEQRQMATLDSWASDFGLLSYSTFNIPSPSAVVLLTTRHSSEVKLVTHSMNRFDPARLIRIALELAAQAGNVIIHRSSRRKRGIPPNHIEEPFPRDWLARPLGHQAHHRELFRSKMDGFSAPHCRLSHQIDFNLAEPKPCRRVGLPVDSPQ